MVPFLLALSAQADTVTYDLTFTGSSFSLVGSGTGTFDDTPVGPGALPGETRYDFASVVGSGVIGTWNSSRLDYDAATGDGEWELSVGASTFVDGTNVGAGLSPIAALEQHFADLESGGYLTWSRVASGVPKVGQPLQCLLLAWGLVWGSKDVGPSRRRRPKSATPQRTIRCWTIRLADASEKRVLGKM
jgi:hypothetical protein